MAPVLAQCRPPRRVRFDAEARRKHAPTNGGGPEGAPAWKGALRSSASPGRLHAGTMLKEEAVTHEGRTDCRGAEHGPMSATLWVIT
jgi:hypothetical protein